MGIGRRTRTWVGAILAVVIAAVALPLVDPWGSPATAAPGLLAGFVEDTVLSGLNGPISVRFSPDGRVFVAEKAGIVKVFDSLSDPTPDVFADLRTNVHNFWDRGLLGLALHPNFPATPYVFVSYTHDAAIGGTAPRWGSAGVSSDPCPTPPGPNADGCVVSGRISRLTAAGNTMTGPEQVLVEDWCQQYPSHSVGALAFGADGMLYGGGGDGANFNFLDYGQDGSPVNPCGDPGGAAPAPPTAEGGALRSQDLRTSGDPLGLNGSILRIDPLTGAGLADNPLGASSDANARRIVGTGLRNPFRLAIRPGTNEVWVADVGGGLWEEIDVIASPADGSVDNFGWPCYEGAPKHPGFDPLDLSICENLYAQPGAVTDPFFGYRHNEQTIPDGACPAGGASIAGIAFAPASGGTYPSSFAGAAFFADFSRDCIWVMRAGPDGRPSPNLVETFVAGATNPVDLQVGLDGALYYVDIYGGTVHRIRYVGETTPPTIAAKTPAPGASGVAVDANVSVTFSESMDASTIDTSRLVLRTGGPSGPVVPASVAYEAAPLRAVIDPVAPLPASTAIHVLVKGGATGVKDTAGNWLATDASWSFTTSAGPPPAPANDAFGSAQVVSGASGSVSGSTTGATKESGEPAHAAGNPGGASVWFRWMAAASGPATVATTGSSFDTLLGVYTGSSVSGLTAVASNDDLSATVFQSSVTFTAVAGTTYQIAVDGWRTGTTVAHGAVNLSWSGPGSPPPGPANDAFGSAQVVSGASGSVSGSTTGATKESGEPAHAAGNPGGASVWFGWTAPASGPATVATTGSSFDTLLGVYTGSGVSGLTAVASNDDLSATVFQSSVTFTAVAGTTYRIAVDGWRNDAGAVATGTVNLSWSGPTPPDTDAPRPEIIDPSAATKWSVGDTINFRGTAADDQDGVLPASGLRWELLLQHCPTDCHAHQIEEYPGVASGSFVAPDHEYPSHLELRLTATDSSGRSTTVSRRLDPLTVDLGFASVPPGLGVGVDGVTTTTPFALTVIVGSAHTVTAPTSQDLEGNDYQFVSWSDGGARVHQIVAPTAPTTLTAVFRDSTAPRVTSTWPVDGSTGASRDVNASAVFSETMNPSLITTTAVTVRQGGSTGPLVAATITYNAANRTVTIDPVARLASKTMYTIVVLGGASGVKDLAGNALAASFTWSFTTR